MSLFYLTEVSAAPPTPDANKFVFYVKPDGLLYFKNDSGVETAFKPTGVGTGDLLSDGSVPLVANWDVGAFKITANQLESDVVSGTAPLIVASTTVVTNLNADKIDGADLIDEDTMVSDSDVHVPTQQSVKAYVDSSVAGGVQYKGVYDASTNTPDLDTTPAGVIKGDLYIVSVAGTFFTTAVEVGDALIAEIDAAAVEADWSILQGNIQYTAAEIKTLYESNSDTNAYDDAAVSKLAGIEANAKDDQTGAEIKTLYEAATGAAVASPIHTLHVETVANQDYVLTFDAPYAGTITTLRTKTESGTCTVTGYINAVALGGTANSASSTAQEQAHASANTYAKGDEIKVTVTSNSTALDLEVTFYGTRTDL